MMDSFKTAFDPGFLESYQKGTLRYRYRGVRCIKSPIDMAIYFSVISDLRPKTVIEIGTRFGGGALFLADAVGNLAPGAKVHTIDLDPPGDIDDPRIAFLRGDVHDLDAVFAAHGLDRAPRPWLVVEDSAHTRKACLAALDFFARAMQRGDMLVMEDGVLDELGLSERYDGGPNRAIAEFFEARPEVFEVAREYCDMFGPNATYAPNGYLRKT